MARIVVVEDDGALRHDLTDRLLAWGHDVVQAADGCEGFAAIAEFQPDIVLSDINMPSGSGIELVRRVTQSGSRYADVIFIFISSDATLGSMIHGIGSGADDYVTKPIDYALLNIKITSHVRKRNNMLSLAAEDHVVDSLGNALMNGVVQASTFAVAGAACLLVVYWIKSALGINIFQDVHLSDLF